MKKRSTNPKMAMMMGRAMRRPALAVNPAVARPAVNPMAAMASAPTMKKGGTTMKSCTTKSDAKTIAKKEVKGHEKSMHKMKSGGKCYAAGGYASGGKASQLSKANGIAVRGKTKGKIC